WSLLDPATGAPLAAQSEPVSAEAQSVAIPVRVGQTTVALLAPTALPTAATAAEAAFVAQVNRALAIAALAAAAVALVAGGLLAASILRPLRRLETAVARVAKGDLTARVPAPGADEVGRLGATFNSMAAGLQEQEELRRRLVADIAHELRTPLSVVQGNLQALLDGIYPLTTDEVQVLFDETRLLTRLVNDLHELAQAEARRLPLTLQAVDLPGALETTAARFAPLAGARAVALTVAPVEASSPPCCVQADPERLAQVLHNLVGNALRHTPAGGQITLASAPAGTGHVRIEVRDNGAGVAAADLPHLFDRFYRAESDRARPADRGGAFASADVNEGAAGAGLGLAIVKALVEAHGGEVGVESRHGEGTTFWFTLPNAPANGQPPSTA
ncbi:MAG: ATP-binding protein, partial [Caldilineaceae bacterium]